MSFGIVGLEPQMVTNGVQHINNVEVSFPSVKAVAMRN